MQFTSSYGYISIPKCRTVFGRSRVFGTISAVAPHSTHKGTEEGPKRLSPENLADQTVPEEHPYAMVHHDTRVVGCQ